MSEFSVLWITLTANNIPVSLQYHKLLYGCQRITLLSQFDWFPNHRISGDICNLTVSGIQVINTENKFCLESVISAYLGVFQYFYSVPFQVK